MSTMTIDTAWIDGWLKDLRYAATSLLARPGFTAMALYRYFPNKEAIIDGVVDAGMGLPPARAEPRGDWRSEVTRWAHAKREMLCARPWPLGAPVRRRTARAELAQLALRPSRSRSRRRA